MGKIVKAIVVGLGEIGMPLYEILKYVYADTIGYDKDFIIKNRVKENFNSKEMLVHNCEYLNICIPYEENDFFYDVAKYVYYSNAKYTIIHTTVPIGTTKKIQEFLPVNLLNSKIVHSPVMGRHDNMKSSLYNTVKFIGGNKKDTEAVAEFLNGAKISCYQVDKAKTTEALKLFSLSRYGLDIAFADYEKQICNELNIPWEAVNYWTSIYNLAVPKNLKRSYIKPPEGKIGGHCVIPGAKMLHNQYPNPMLVEVLKCGKK